MENTNLQLFFRIISRADVKLLVQDSIFGMFSFNDYTTIEKHELFLEDNYQSAIFEHMANLNTSIDFPSAYCKCLLTEFDSLVALFQHVDGYLIHKRLSITDTDSNNYLYSDMPEEIKKKISLFLFIQRRALFRIILNIFGSENSPFALKYKDIEDSAIEFDSNNQATITEKKTEFTNFNVSDKTVWLDNEDVCRLLKVTKRTLQSYRDKNWLPYYRIGKKIYFKVTDINRILEMSNSFRIKNGE